MRYVKFFIWLQKIVQLFNKLSVIDVIQNDIKNLTLLRYRVIAQSALIALILKPVRLYTTNWR